MRAARLAAVQTVYQMRYGKQDALAAARDYLDNYAGMDVEGEPLLEPDESLYSSIVQGVFNRKDDLAKLLYDALKQGRQSKLSTEKQTIEFLLESIFLCGIYELLMHHDIDAPIIISDYVSVTQAFCENKESGLVNAVLDNVSHSVRD